MGLLDMFPMLKRKPAVDEAEVARIRDQKKYELIEEAKRWIGAKHAQTLTGSLAFVPWIIQQSEKEGVLGHNVIVHRGEKVIVKKWSISMIRTIRYT
jgi:hypothetical protein